MVERIREMCMALPEATERLSHGEPTWFVRDKKVFVMFADHHHDDRVAVWLPARAGVQESLISENASRYFRPPYVGCRGWIGIVLDGEVDWDEVREFIKDSYRLVAPKKLAELV